MLEHLRRKSENKNQKESIEDTLSTLLIQMLLSSIKDALDWNSYPEVRATKRDISKIVGHQSINVDPKFIDTSW